MDGSLLKFNNGVGYIALQSRAIIVPMFFQDTSGFKLFKPVNIIVGKPMELTGITGDGKVTSEMTEKATGLVLEALTGLM
jgi:hypothetical protein